jgi:hypothetical protein
METSSADTFAEVLKIPTSTESRVLTLLGSGIPPETVAASLGISASRISQLLSDDHFAARVAELRFKSLSKHNERDANYDDLEDTLMERLKDCLPLMHRPMEILKAIQVINAAKRRGASAPSSIIEKQTIIALTLPAALVHKFSTNLQGQVTRIDNQDLITIQSGNLKDLVQIKGNENGRPALPSGEVAITADQI